MDNNVQTINLNNYDEKWQKLIDSMLTKNYHERLSIDDILSKLD